jgi:hypothetical protein
LYQTHQYSELPLALCIEICAAYFPQKWPWKSSASKVHTGLNFLNHLFLNVFVANAFISAFKTQTMHIRSFNTQQHCNVSLKTLYPGGLRNPGLLVPEADAASTAPRPQGIV